MYLLQKLSRLLVTLAFVVPVTARAGSSGEAGLHLDRALDMLSKGNPAEAASEFLRSYEIDHDFTVLYNLGVSYLRATPSETVQAVDALQRYLDEGGTSIPDDRRKKVEEVITYQKTQISRLEIRGAPDGAVVRVDNHVIGKAPISVPVRVSTGTHVIVVTPPNQKSLEFSVTVAGQEHRTIELAPSMERSASDERPLEGNVVTSVQKPLEEDTPPPPGPTIRPPSTIKDGLEPHTSSPGRMLRFAGFATAGLGAGTLVAGAVLGLFARSRNQSALDSCPQAPCSQKANALEHDARDFAREANYSFLAGGSLVVTGAVLYIISAMEQPPAQKQARLLLFAGPGSIGLATGGTW